VREVRVRRGKRKKCGGEEDKQVELSMTTVEAGSCCSFSKNLRDKVHAAAWDDGDRVE
jgi:hypothetical protein